MTRLCSKRTSYQVRRVIFKVEDTFASCEHEVLFTCKFLACDRVRQTRYLEGVPASISRYYDSIESHMRTECRDNEGCCE